MTNTDYYKDSYDFVCDNDSQKSNRQKPHFYLLDKCGRLQWREEVCMSCCLTGGVRPSRKRRYSWYSLSVSSYLEISDLMAIIIALIFLISFTFSIFSLASASALHKNEQFFITFFKARTVTSNGSKHVC